MKLNLYPKLIFARVVVEADNVVLRAAATNHKMTLIFHIMIVTQVSLVCTSRTADSKNSKLGHVGFQPAASLEKLDGTQSHAIDHQRVISRTTPHAFDSSLPGIPAVDEHSSADGTRCQSEKKLGRALAFIAQN